jgi:hypothetical protein
MLQDKVQLAQAFSAVGSSVWTGIIVQHYDTFDYSPSACGSDSWFQLVPEHFTVMDTVYCCAALLIVCQNWPLCIPKECQHHFPRRRLSFEPPFDWQRRIFPFHSVVFAFWSLMVDPCLISSDNAPQKENVTIMTAV